MANYNRNITVLLHIKEYCEQIQNAFEKNPVSFEEFAKDDIIKDAISMKIFQIGELVNHLSSEYLTETQNETDWNSIRGMRNKFAHGYFDMNIEIIYKTAKDDIPDLYKFICKEVDRLFKTEQEDNEEEI